MAALTTVITFLLRQIKDVTARAEALRVLLVNRGVFSQDEYERMRADALLDFDSAMQAVIRESHGLAKSANIQRLFETPTGKPQ